VKLYLCTCLERREDAQNLARVVGIWGFDVVSTWHAQPVATREHEATLSPAAAEEIAATNADELDTADAVLFLADARCRGALVEIGMAAGREIPVAAVGDPRCVTPMARIPGVMWFDSTPGALETLSAFFERADGWAWGVSP
jgi:nucleoside 2-deoxyribosyltransferase